MKKLIALFIIFAGSLTAIEGNYDVTGFDPYDNKPYTGTVSIKKDKNDVYQASWNIVEEGKKFTYSGTGLKTDNQVSFTYRNTSPGQDELGLQIYKISDKALEGPFVYLNKNLIGKEKLVKK